MKGTGLPPRPHGLRRRLRRGDGARRPRAGAPRAGRSRWTSAPACGRPRRSSPSAGSMALRLLLLRHAETDWNRERRYQGWTDTALSEVGRGQAEAAGRLLARAAPRRGLVEPAPPRAGHRRGHRRAHGLAVKEHAAFMEMGFGDWEGLTAAEVARALPRGAIRPGSTRRISSPAPAARRSTRSARRVLAGLEELRADARRRDVCLVAHGISARILILEALGLGARAPLVAPRRRRPASRSSSSATDWTALHRMNTLVHLDERAGDAGRSAAGAGTQLQPTQLPKGAKIYLPDEAAQKARGGGAPPRRLPALGLSRAGHVGLRVLRRALPGHGPRPAGADVQDGGPRERAAARPARGHHAADRAHRGDADARRAQAAAPRLRHQRLPLRRAARGPLPRVLPGGRGAGGAPQPGRRRRDDRDDGGGAPRARPRALPDRRGPGRLLPRHPRGPRRRRGHGARAALGARPQGPELRSSASWTGSARPPR